MENRTINIGELGKPYINTGVELENGKQNFSHRKGGEGRKKYGK